MKKTVYKGKSKDELLKTLSEKRVSLRKMKFGVAGSKKRDVKEISNTKKEIARMLTELNRK